MIFTDSVCTASTLPSNLLLWHARMMHHYVSGLQHAICDEIVTGITLDLGSAPDPICQPCLTGKMHAEPFCPTGTVTDTKLGQETVIQLGETVK